MAAPSKPSVPTPTTNSLANAPVAFLQMHLGVMVNHQMVTALHHEKHNVRMSLVPFGVHVEFLKSKEMHRYVIPFSNIHSVQLLDEATNG
jgi:hypothetical protein